MIRRLPALLISAAALTLVLATAGPASAAARVSISSSAGSAAASATGATTLTLSGNGFQSIPRAFGGIYVFFGVVESGAWRPSQGGASGRTFRYIPDSESADNQGYQRFVSFPGSETSTAANGGEVAADGSWRTTLRVPGPVINVIGRSGATEQVDCRTATCGVITVGAHGVKNANNETFTPVRFVGGSAQSGSGSSGNTGAGASSGGQATTGTTGGTTGSGTTSDSNSTDTESVAEADEDVAAQEVSLGIDRATAIAGRVMSFTARGFLPGEQVTAVLDDGVAAQGPLVAGGQGEVGSVIQLPRDLRIGTHSLRVTGAASGITAQAEFTVTPPADALPVTEATLGAPESGTDWAWIAVVVAAATLAIVLIAGLIGARRARREARDRVEQDRVEQDRREQDRREQDRDAELQALLEEARAQGFAEVMEARP